MKNYEIEDYKINPSTEEITINCLMYKESINEDVEVEAKYNIEVLLSWLLAEAYIDNYFYGPDGLTVSFTIPREDRDISSTLHISEFLNRTILDEFLNDNI